MTNKWIHYCLEASNAMADIWIWGQINSFFSMASLNHNRFSARLKNHAWHRITENFLEYWNENHKINTSTVSLEGPKARAFLFSYPRKAVCNTIRGIIICCYNIMYFSRQLYVKGCWNIYLYNCVVVFAVASISNSTT